MSIFFCDIIAPMKNEIYIRKATLEDVKDINDIVNEAIRTSASNWAWSERSYEDALQWFKGHDDNKYFIFVAEIDGKPVGYSSFSKLRDKKGYWPVVENSVYVHKDFRGRGIGASLLEKLILSGKDSDIWAISAWIDSCNKESILLHEKFGFYITGELKNVGEKFNEKRSVTIMQYDYPKE